VQKSLAIILQEQIADHEKKTKHGTAPHATPKQDIAEIEAKKSSRPSATSK